VAVDGTTTLRPSSPSVVSLVTTGPVSAAKFGEATNSSPWLGDLAELILYDRPLDAAERRAVEDYLLAKYVTTGVVTTPVISPAGGVFTDAVTVSLSTQTPGDDQLHADFRARGDLCPYGGPFTLSATTTVKAERSE
jgi:hypothetical protein